jgi:hypothetical protein
MGLLLDRFRDWSSGNAAKTVVSRLQARPEGLGAPCTLARSRWETRRVVLLHFTRSHEQQSSWLLLPHESGGMVEFALAKEARISMSAARSSLEQPREMGSSIGCNRHMISSTSPRLNHKEPIIPKWRKLIISALGISKSDTCERKCVSAYTRPRNRGGSLRFPWRVVWKGQRSCLLFWTTEFFCVLFLSTRLEFTIHI